MSQWWFATIWIFLVFCLVSKNLFTTKVKVLLTSLFYKRKLGSKIKGNRSVLAKHTGQCSHSLKSTISEIHSMQLNSQMPLDLFWEEHAEYLVPQPKDDLIDHISEPTTQIKCAYISHSTWIPDLFRQNILPLSSSTLSDLIERKWMK